MYRGMFVSAKQKLRPQGKQVLQVYTSDQTLQFQFATYPLIHPLLI